MLRQLNEAASAVRTTLSTSSRRMLSLPKVALSPLKAWLPRLEQAERARAARRGMSLRMGIL